jgi:hypothetical protein
VRLFYFVYFAVQVWNGAQKWFRNLKPEVQSRSILNLGLYVTENTLHPHYNDKYVNIDSECNYFVLSELWEISLVCYAYSKCENMKLEKEI